MNDTPMATKGQQGLPFRLDVVAEGVTGHDDRTSKGPQAAGLEWQRKGAGGEQKIPNLGP